MVWGSTKEGVRMKLETLTRGQCQLVREWRNAEPQFLRTPHMITEKMQDEFYDNVINNRDSKHRYFAVKDEETFIDNVHLNTTTKIYKEQNTRITFVGMGGLTNIEWENGTAEISLIIAPEYRGQGKGKEAVDLLLDMAFKSMRLNTIWGEVYTCGNVGFWKSIVKKYDAFSTILPSRKMWNSVYHGSMWFSVHRGDLK